MTTRGNALAAGERKGEAGGGVVLFREHAPVIGRVCMALLGDAALAERALERVAAEVGSARVAAGQDPRVRMLGMARVACSNQLSKLPMRTAAGVAPDAGSEPALARAALGRLKPTEREAVVLHVVGGLEAAQVGEACGIDVTTARARIARGVSQLLEQENQR